MAEIIELMDRFEEKHCPKGKKGKRLRRLIKEEERATKRQTPKKAKTTSLSPEARD